MALMAVAVMLVRAQEIKLPLRFDYYTTVDQMNESLKALNKAYPQLTTLDQVGKSEEGRIIWALTINNPKTGEPLSKPGIYVDGNIHGNEIQAGEVCLYLANRLLTNYGRLEEITEAIDRNVFYIIPVVNVDGRYHFMKEGNTSSSNRGLRIPRDDDRDGLVDEDFPNDLDGDGNILNMRIKDPYGRYKTSTDDPRLMVQVKPGEQGEWTMLGQEGVDSDGDGQFNEDSEGYVDGNRNWGFNWKPNYFSRGAGNYPFEGVGLKAIAEWMIARPNIIMVFAYHNAGGMFLRGPSFQAAGDFPRADITVYDYLGGHFEKIVPGYDYMISWKDLYPTYGDFTDFTNNIIGCYSIVSELFQNQTETYDGSFTRKQSGERMSFGGASDADRQRMLFDHNVNQGELFTPWKPITHPQYGEIELGGWSKYSSRLPHPFMLTDLIHRNAATVIFAARNTPNISMDVFEIKKLEGDLYSVRVRLANSGAMHSITSLAIKNKLYPMDKLTVSGRNAKVVSGGELTNQWLNQVNYKEYKPELQWCQVPGFGKVDYQFLISGRGEVEIRFESRKAGTVSKRVTLR